MTARLMITCDGTRADRPTMSLNECRAALPTRATTLLGARVEAAAGGWSRAAPDRDLCPACARVAVSAEQRAADAAAETYDAAADGYDLAADPRCLWGWGPPTCHHRCGHACFRAVGHVGLCGDENEQAECPQQRPADWDTVGRVEANR